MNLTMGLSDLSISGLAHRCREETERFYHQLQHDERYCFEIFRRAILNQDEQAWHLIVQQYTSQVTAWIRRCESFRMVDEVCDYFVNHAFAKFWHAFIHDPLKFNKFNSLKALLQYLKLCTYSSLKDYATRRMTPNQVPVAEMPYRDNAPNPATTVSSHMVAERVWQRVLRIVKTDQEQIIARAYLVHNMKPKEIFNQYQEAFVNVSEVRRVKDNFMERLRRDKELLGILESHA